MTTAAHWPCGGRKREGKHKRRTWAALPCFRASSLPETRRAGRTAGSGLDILLTLALRPGASGHTALRLLSLPLDDAEATVAAHTRSRREFTLHAGRASSTTSACSRSRLALAS